MINQTFEDFYRINFVEYLNELAESPLKIFTTLLDVIIVVFLIYKAVKMLRKTRAWQLLKGIAVLIFITILSGFFELHILNYILTSLMSYGVIMLIIVFQPELRRGLEQLGTTNKISRWFGIDQDLNSKKKENIYVIIVIALFLLSVFAPSIDNLLGKNSFFSSISPWLTISFWLQ